MEELTTIGIYKKDRDILRRYSALKGYTSISNYINNECQKMEEELKEFDRFKESKRKEK